MNEYLQKLKDMYGYDDELLKLLYSVIPSLIEYYGIERKDLILSAIEDTTIIIDEDSELLQNNGTEALAATSIVKTPDGFKTRSVIFAKRTIKKAENLVRELCTIIKYYGQDHYENGQYVIKTGLKVATARYDEEKMKLGEFVEEEADLEEAFNDYDTYMVLKIAGLDTSSLEDDGTLFVLRLLSERVDFQRDIQNGQFTNDKTYITTLGEYYTALKKFKESRRELTTSGILGLFASPNDMYTKEAWDRLDIDPKKKKELLTIFTDYTDSTKELLKMIVTPPTI